jgi:hypothetical protein
MSRRSHVVRDDEKAGQGSPRTLGGGEISCAYRGCGYFSPGDSGGDDILRIDVYPSVNYQRYYASATVSNVTAYGGECLFQIRTSAGNIAPARAWALRGPITLSAVFDLPEAEPDSWWWIGLYASPGESVEWDGATLQVIKAQTVSEPGCTSGGGPVPT